MNIPEEVHDLIMEVESHSADTVRLAEVVSLAARIEPQVVRALRLAMLPDSDAGLEADLWFSPLAQSGSSAELILLPEVIPLLRERLAGKLERLQAAWEILEKLHRDSPSAIRAEERITYLSLAGLPGSKKEIDRIMESFLAAFRDDVNRGRNLGRWAIRALPQMSDAVKHRALTFSVGIVASAYVDGRRVLDANPSRVGKWTSLASILPADLPRAEAWVRLIAGGIQFASDRMEGAHSIQIPQTNPFIVEVSWNSKGAHSKLVSWAPGEFTALSTRARNLTLRTALGDVFAMRPSVATRKRPPIKKSAKKSPRQLDTAGASQVRNRINAEISKTKAPNRGKPKKGQDLEALVETLSASQKRKLEERILGVAFEVAEERQFSQALLESKSFDVTLDWLKSLRNDADFQGFETTIQKYHLAQSNNVAKELADAVRDLTKGAAFENDSFRFASRNATLAVLAEALSLPYVQARTDMTQAELFGRKLATFNVKKLVHRYLSYFLHATLVSLITKSGLSNQKSDSTSARLADRQAKRITNRVVNTLQARGKLNDVSAAKEILVQELGNMAQPKEPTLEAKR